MRQGRVQSNPGRAGRRVPAGLALGTALALALVARAEPAGRFAPLLPPPLGAGERVELEEDGLLIRPLDPSHADGLAVEMMALVDAAPARVWSVIRDCEGQDEYLPRVTRAEVRDREGDAHTCELVIDLPFPLDDSRAASRNHARRLPDGGYQRHWTLAPGEWSYEHSDGSWTVHPWDDDRSLLVNRMDLLPRSILPVWLLRAAQARQAPATFDAIRERVRTHGVDADAGD
ncbi:MAG: SRPBCC family protein [Myxococcota bacterium]